MKFGFVYFECQVQIRIRSIF